MEDTIVLYPSPGRGHLFSMVELGKQILKHHPSISITIIVSAMPTEPISIDDPYFSTLRNTNRSITLIHLPQVSLPPNTSFSPLDFAASFFELPELNNTNLHQTLLNLSKSSNIKALIIDFFCSAAFEFVSSRHNIPIYFFYTSGASGLCTFLHLPILDKIITKSLKDLDIIIDFHGIPKIPSKELPLAISDRSHRVYQYFVDTAKLMIKSAGLILNTFELLERKALQAIQEGKCGAPDEPVPPLFCVGPLLTTSESKSEHECLTWLDSQPTRSVLFLCFGSMGVFNSRQLRETAIGLEKSGVRFLWVVRPPLADSQTQAGRSSTPNEPCLDLLLPEGFLERTEDRGFLVNSWAPQVEILNHGSVGGFVTHCGWNSVLEALCAGVPMVAWPLYAEQRMNRIFLVEGMKVALAFREAGDDHFVNAAELEERVIELMNSEKGEAVRERVLKLREDAVAAKSDGGSSCIAMAKLVDCFKKG
ncbi:UDP-glycosyltransferase 88B1-like [Populus nigra]|uniref:UDP-glycosyltransferase 88B1-like n=1 Tax=Populus nigra TaxID=3691 RepID=UPI002B26F8B6|nr:UDP-glycosyltransferase 88B1-like [Populus nigra]